MAEAKTNKTISEMKEEDRSYNFSEVEIEKAYEVFGTTAFWTDYTNVEMMQCIVDTKFSSFPGSEYVVDVQYFSTPRLVISCLMCSGRIELKSYHHFVSHHEGKIHLKNCALVTKSVDEFPPLVRRECLGNLRQFPLGSLERDIADNKTPIVGVSFVFKESVSGCVIYYCDLCKQRQLSHKDMLTHLNSDSHTKCYIHVVLHEESPRSAKSMSEKKLQIEKHDGRIHYNICDMNDGKIQEFLCTCSLSSTNLAANNKGPTSETTSKKKVLEGDEPDTEDAAINVSKCKDEEQMVPLEKMKTLCKKVEKFASQHNMTDTAERMEVVYNYFNKINLE